ncbi:hypothetical protein B0H16DRAFT_1627858 [Mycena metata]|uniref:CCHC-type domain-containing protein n=1 Tax=Mycena metata TaxID=1033252 RepID=A0AAD7H3R2_9AGAR|nr:hypothetical protein B0H16DRAFT_1627858 [Mycena metata]
MAPGKAGISGQSSPFIGPNGVPIRGVAKGSIVLSPDTIDVFRRMEAAREKRNDRKAERRAGGEKDVSDDELDELAPFLMVVPSGEKSGRGKTGDTAVQQETVPSLPHPSDTLLFEDSVAEKNSFKAHDDSIPAAVFSLAKNGISPPLTLFLPGSLERIRAGNVKTVKHGTGETTKVTVIDVSEFPDEETLDQASFQTCYNTFLTFLQGASGPRVYGGFTEHYNRMLNDPGLPIWFVAYQQFDKKIRAQFFTKPYIIDVRDSEYRDALQAAKSSFLMASGDQGKDSDSFGVVRSGTERQERRKPYERDEGPHSVLCFRCGRMGHNAVRCSEANPSKHGRNFVITASREGLFRIHDNRPVCMRFNCGSCDASGNNHAIHMCSLCGDPLHGAVDCIRN